MMHEIEQIRREKGIEKKYLCDRSGITRANYDRAIHRNDIKLSKFISLCQTLNLQLTWVSTD